jgi:hypothetical protein
VPRFACAIWRPIGANTGGVISNNLGLILHHAVASGSLWSFFNSPSAQVSAHFWVSRTGVIEQYVDTSVVAWHGKSLNSRYVGVETEGCGPAPHAEPMPEAMIDAMGRLYAEGMRVHGWANRDINAEGQNGFGFHRMAVNTACPCDVRLNMRPEIRRRATGGATAPPKPEAPEAPPKPKLIRGTDGDDMTSLQDETFTHVWGQQDGKNCHWWQFLPGKGKNPDNNWFFEWMPKG